MSVNPEDWDVDFAFPDFNLALFERERSWCRNWIVTFPWKKIWSVFENFNADHAWRREWTGRNSRGFPKKINERILRQWQQTYLEKLLCLLRCFLKGPTEERWKRLRERHSARFPKYSRVSLVPKRSLLPSCPREVWSPRSRRVSETSQLTVESRFDRAENT